MALQHFVQQSAQNNSNSVEARAVSQSVSVKKPEPESDAEIQPSPALGLKNAPDHTQAVADDLVKRKPVSLTPHDREILSSLAAVQIRYNRPAEAVPYLMMLRKTDPSDHQAARLLALALMKLGNWEQAEVILDDINETADSDETVKGIVAFYRGLVAFKQRKMSAARQWLQRFRILVTGGTA